MHVELEDKRKIQVKLAQWARFSLKYRYLLAHLSQGSSVRAFLIKICLLSVLVMLVVVVVGVKFSPFHLLLQNHWANLNQTWHKVSLGEGIEVYSNEGPCPFSRGDNYDIAKIY